MTVAYLALLAACALVALYSFVRRRRAHIGPHPIDFLSATERDLRALADRRSEVRHQAEPGERRTAQ